MAPLPLLALTAALSAALPTSIPAAVPTAPQALSAPAVVVHATGGQRHTVKAGETAFDLARRYGTTVAALAAANGLADPALIQPGQTLTIPSGAASAPAGAGAYAGGYTVRAGDTLSHIAAATGTSVSAIGSANGISPSAFIYPGQRLTIPGAGSSATAPAQQRPATTGSYTVQGGDTLSGIAAARGSSVTAIAKANGISPGALLQVGQRLSIPTRTDRSGTTGTTGPSPTAAPWADTMPGRSEIRNLIASTAAEYGVDQRLALAIAWQESGWQHGLTSSAGAVGAMQVMPDSGTWAGGLIGRDLDLRNARDNITAGVVILRQLGAMAKDRDEVIAAYYQGLGSVRERGWYADTRQYVANVNYFMTRV